MFNKEMFKPFDYSTNIDYGTLVEILEKQEFAFSDYGVTKEEVMDYIHEITFYNTDIKHILSQKDIIYQHRCNFFIVIAILTEIYLFFFIVGHFNDFMKDIELFYDILLYPFYTILGIMIYRMHRFIENIIYSIKKFFQRKFIYSILGRNTPKIKKLLDDIQKTILINNN